MTAKAEEVRRWTLAPNAPTRAFDGHKAITITSIGDFPIDSVPVAPAKLVVNFFAGVASVVLDIKSVGLRDAVSQVMAEYARNRALYDLGATGTMSFTRSTSQSSVSWTLPVSTAWAMVQALDFGALAETEEVTELALDADPFAK